MVKMQAAVINTVQPTLEAIVFSTHTWEEVSLVVTDGDIKRVNSMVHALGDQLCKDDSGAAVQRCIAEVVLPCSAEGSIDNPVLGFDIKGGRGRD